MRVWVSGSSGTLGSEVVRQLHERGEEVVEADVVGDPPVDLLDPDAVARSMRGVDAVVHCAGIPSPEAVTAAHLVHVNVLTTLDALEQAWLAGVRSAVLASSGSIYGTAWSPTPMSYDAVPVDEDTPLRYVDPYAFTKDALERAGAMYARRGMTVTALRLHWIIDTERARAEADRGDDEQGVRNLWGYVDRGDAARACVLALAPRPPHRGFEAVVVASHETLSHRPVEDLLAEYLPGAERRRPLTGTQGLFDCTRAEQVLGWRSRASWRSG